MSKMAHVLDFKGANALVIPKRSENRTLDAAFVTEGGTFPVKQDQYGSAPFNRHKMGIITTISNEIMRVSRPEIVTLVEEAILTDTAEAIDGFMFDANAAVVGVRPAGLLFGVTPVASSGNSIENVLTDLKYLLGEMIAIRARKPVILINPLLVASLSLKTTTGTGISPFKDDLERGLLGGLPYIAADTMPVDEVYALDADSLFIGIDVPEIDFSNSASLVMLNDDGTDPTMLETGAITNNGSVQVSDAALVTGGPAQVQSLFQTWSIAMRYVQPVSWGVARMGTLSALNGVNW
ncbi:phage major capsid protein [Shimia thalassica]|uniref:phage major capsid protein n=1 Tax=Shimia thalassica TaxID=1715693 RepID=UPI0026E29D5A|nr:phage major capsid protein [Shimia thalassica]MDO6520726.1 phage major capsid protein [Shimia thalassica]